MVAKVRRALRTRAVGHAGTLDPMATGVLVVCVGEGTKLVAHLTGHGKRYRTTIKLGVETHSLDAQGETTVERPVPSDFATRVPAAIEAERARTQQIPPAVSAIKVDGRAAHKRVRAGETLELAPREVKVEALEVLAVRADEIDLEVACSKGYYVRSLARDLAAALGTVGHLVALRRVVSGPFAIEDCTPLDGDLAGALVPFDVAVRRLFPCVTLTDLGVLRARQGKRLADDDFVTPPGEGLVAWLDASASPIALGERTESGHEVRRGMRAP